jgi:hypothetical protein
MYTPSLTLAGMNAMLRDAMNCTDGPARHADLRTRQ